MNFFPFLQAVLYTFSTALLYPVVFLLLLLCLWLLIYTGGFFAELIQRRQFRANGRLTDYLETIQAKREVPSEVKGSLPLHIQSYAKDLARIVGSGHAFVDECIEDLNQRKQYTLMREVDKIRLIVRVGPSLGLMGTLIPMGTGLASLTQGNMAQLSASLILAFTTTVVGLALGITAHFYSVVKERWFIEDMRHINLITEAMTRDA